MGARRMQHCTRSEQMGGAMTPGDDVLAGVAVGTLTEDELEGRDDWGSFCHRGSCHLGKI